MASQYLEPVVWASLLDTAQAIEQIRNVQALFRFWRPRPAEYAVSVSNSSTRYSRLQRYSLRVIAVACAVSVVPATKSPQAEDKTTSAAVVSVRTVGICVSDVGRSLNFYANAFGFKVSAKTLQANAAFAPLLELENVDATIRFVDTGSIILELFQYTHPKATGDVGKRQAMNRIGLTNLQFKVTDLPATLEAVKRAGGVVLEKARLPATDNKTIAIFVLDPDGIRIELVAG
jgi:glyoxylase I family protein